jgi:RNA methyltransferase, TrmH family
MLSTSRIRMIRSLEQKKYRLELGCFVAQGDKIARELLGSNLNILQVYALESWIESNRDIFWGLKAEIIQVSASQLERISYLKSPNQALAVVELPQYQTDEVDLKQNLTLFLDGIQDPGNLGTIIRTADWFGVRNIYCSKTTADLYNPKVIQSTMGSFIRVKVHYTEPGDFFPALDKNIRVYGALLEGENITAVSPQLPAILVIGNESQGISQELQAWINHRVRIEPSHAGSGPESLNAAVAAGILMAWFRKI